MFIKNKIKNLEAQIGKIFLEHRASIEIYWFL